MTFDTPVLPASLVASFAGVQGQNASADPDFVELTIAISALNYARNGLFGHVQKLNRVQCALGDRFKQNVILSLDEMYRTLTKIVITLSSQRDNPTVDSMTFPIMLDLQEKYKRIIQTAEFCDLIARHSSGKLADFFRALHAVIYRSLGVRHFFRRLSDVFTNTRFDELFQSLEADWRGIHKEAQEVAYAYQNLETLFPHLSLVLFPGLPVQVATKP